MKKSIFMRMQVATLTGLILMQALQPFTFAADDGKNEPPI